MTLLTNFRHMLVSAVVLAASLPAQGQSMTDAFDKLDSDEFRQELDRARRCASAGDFICSDRSFAAASRLAATPQDKAALQQAITHAAGKKQDAANIVNEQEELSAQQAQESRARQRQQRVAAQARTREKERAEAEEEQRAAQARTAGVEQILQSQARVATEISRANREIQAARAVDQAEQAARRRAAEQERQANARERDRVKDQQLANASEQTAQRRQEEQRERAAAQRRADAEAQTRRDQLLAQQRAEHEEELRQKRAAERAEREAKVAAERAAEQEAKKRYLVEMIRGIRLKATKCPDGAGHYYATGSRPNIKPETVSCIDVRYEARCVTSNAVSRGVAQNYIGMSGCFGDTYQIEPKPACAVGEVEIKVTDVQPCS